MPFLKVVNGQATEWGLSFDDLRFTYRQTSFPSSGWQSGWTFEPGSSAPYNQPGVAWVYYNNVSYNFYGPYKTETRPTVGSDGLYHSSIVNALDNGKIYFNFATNSINEGNSVSTKYLSVLLTSPAPNDVTFNVSLDYGKVAPNSSIYPNTWLSLQSSQIHVQRGATSFDIPFTVNGNIFYNPKERLFDLSVSTNDANYISPTGNILRNSRLALVDDDLPSGTLKLINNTVVSDNITWNEIRSTHTNTGFSDGMVDGWFYGKVELSPSTTNYVNGLAYANYLKWDPGAAPNGYEWVLQSPVYVNATGTNTTGYIWDTNYSVIYPQDSGYYKQNWVLQEKILPIITSTQNVYVNEGNSGTSTAAVTVSLSSISTSPVSIAYRTINGNAVSGTDYTGVSGTLTFAPGETSKTVDINIIGDTLYEPREYFAFELSNPTNGVIDTALNNGQVLVIINNDDTPSLPIITSTQNVYVNEGNSGTSTAAVTVSLSSISTSPVSIAYRTINGNAVSGTDYVGVNGILTFAPGETSKTINIAINGDTSYEGYEYFAFELSNPTNGVIDTSLVNGQRLLFIQNDDTPSLPIITSFTPNVLEFVEGNTGTTNAAVTVSLSAVSTSAVSVNYKTINGDAISGSDYVGVNGILTFAPGETSKTINIAINGDTSYEGYEYFAFELSNPTNGVIDTSLVNGQRLLFIQNDDVPVLNRNTSSTNSNDLILSSSNNEYIDAKDGFDTVKFTGSRGDHSIIFNSGEVTISDKITSNDGTDKLVNVEKISFDDGSLIFDLAFNADNALIYRLYKAAFARTPDEDGLRFWANTKAKGSDFNSISEAFRNSQEFKLKYGEINNNDYVNKLYNNVLGREPDASGLAWWQNELNSGHQTRDQVLIGFAGSPENFSGTAANIDNGYWIV